MADCTTTEKVSREHVIVLTDAELIALRFATQNRSISEAVKAAFNAHGERAGTNPNFKDQEEMRTVLSDLNWELVHELSI